VCSYPTTCGEPDRAGCVGGVWWLEHATCAPRCPDTMPDIGDPFSLGPCSIEAQACAWTTPACRVGATCIGGKWLETGCLPPTNDAHCPPSLPPSGPDLCGARILDCRYDNGCGGVDLAHCRGVDVWSVTPGACDASACPAAFPAQGAPCTPGCAPPCKYAFSQTCDASCTCGSDGRWGCYLACSDGGPQPPQRCEEHMCCTDIGGTCSDSLKTCECEADGMHCTSTPH
jgi:hypothetical protein